MHIPSVLAYMFPDVGREGWKVQDDSNGKGPYIAEWNLTDPQPTVAELQVIGDSPEFMAWDRLRLNATIDRQTAATINKAIHPKVPTDEALGTIRDMVVQIINAIGLAPTANFARLNEIAIAAIKEAAARKAKL